MTLRVCDATGRDADAIRDLDGLSPASRRLLDHDLDAADRCCVVAYLDDEVVGYAAALVQLGEAQILDVVVAPGWRRRGVATRLLTAVADRAAQRGARASSLEVRADSVGAQALYRRLGFAVEGRRPRYNADGEDALIMWRRSGAAGTRRGPLGGHADVTAGRGRS